MTIHKTFSIKPSEIKKKWLVIDADGLVLGRLASLIAKYLNITDNDVSDDDTDLTDSDDDNDATPVRYTFIQSIIIFRLLPDSCAEHVRWSC